MDRKYIDTSALERIAFATSAGHGASRWTELAIYYRPGERRQLLAESIGKSRVVGDQEFRRQRVEKTLEAAVAMFDRSALAEDVIAQAQGWVDRKEAELKAAHPLMVVNPPSIRFDGAGGLLGALKWLYGDDKTEGALSGEFERDWGVPARTVRDGLKKQTDGADLPSWCKAWLGALQHFDREAFHASRRPA